mmetsp:Transcript_9056/g.18316  ORF Transcript_9056/g.18316 Transcript_9056/m.18316 type:complete len:218 (+) Transcript_9056:539-1192(+)
MILLDRWSFTYTMFEWMLPRSRAIGIRSEAEQQSSVVRCYSRLRSVRPTREFQERECIRLLCRDPQGMVERIQAHTQHLPVDILHHRVSEPPPLMDSLQLGTTRLQRDTQEVPVHLLPRCINLLDQDILVILLQELRTILNNLSMDMHRQPTTHLLQAAMDNLLLLQAMDNLLMGQPSDVVRRWSYCYLKALVGKSSYFFFANTQTLRQIGKYHVSL